MLNLNSLLQGINEGIESTYGPKVPASKFQENSDGDDGEEILDGKKRRRKKDIGEGGELFQARI